MKNTNIVVNKNGTPEPQQWGVRVHSAHLWPARVLSVIEIIVINAEKRVQVWGGKIPQAQSLEVIYPLHQACGWQRCEALHEFTQEEDHFTGPEVKFLKNASHFLHSSTHDHS